MKRIDVEIENIDQKVATKAYQLRAKYTFLKGMDAIQVASAVHTDCEIFVTNDKKLKTIEEISILLLGEYAI